MPPSTNDKWELEDKSSSLLAFKGRLRGVFHGVFPETSQQIELEAVSCK